MVTLYDLGISISFIVGNSKISIINDVIFDEFTKEKDVDENHRIIARLPISTYWTTNYDSLIEDALIEEKRVVDVKYNNKQLSLTKPHRDTTCTYAWTN